MHPAAASSATSRWRRVISNCTSMTNTAMTSQAAAAATTDHPMARPTTVRRHRSDRI